MQYKIYCDMDGVLADFTGAISKQFYDGKPWDELKKQHKEKWQDTFRPQIMLDTKFWQDLPYAPGAQHLWDYIKGYNPFILSAYATWDEESCKKGKRLWLAKYVRVPESRVILCERQDKVKYASPTSILIDDYDKNVREWNAHGGIGIQHTTTAKTISELQKLGIK